MRALLALISKGYAYHTSGRVPAAKAESLIKKFRARYAINPDRVEAQRRRRKGEANARFLLHPAREGAHYDFWLLVTEGSHPAFTAERIKDARLKRCRLVFQDQYEAIQLPAQGSVTRWTWRLTQKSYENHAQWLRDSVRHDGDDSAVQHAIQSIHKMPGFRGIRNQVAGLRKVVAGEWRRVKGAEACPYLPKRIQGYERFKIYNTIDMGLVTPRLLEGKEPFNLSDGPGRARRKRSARMSVSIKLPLEAEKVVVKKVDFDRDTFEKMEAYADAFAIEHGSPITVEALIPLLIEFAFEKDTKFKKYLKERRSESLSVQPAPKA